MAWSVAYVAAAGQTVLAQKAATLAAGQSLRLTTNVTEAQLSPEGSDILQWAISAAYNPIAKRIDFIGKRDGPNPFHWLRYLEGTDTWAVDAEAVSWTSGTDSGHGYDHNTTDQVNGFFYHVPYNSKTVQKWNGSSWSTLTAWTQNTTATGGLTWTPWSNGTIFYNDGFGLLRYNAGSWTTVVTGDGVSYHDFSEYNSTSDVLIFGGGNSSGYFKCTSGLTVTSITSPPFGISANAGAQGICASDPNAGKLIARNVETGAWAAYDIAGDSWTTLTQSTGAGATPQTGTPNLANSASNAEICVSIPGYGVTMWMQVRAGTTMDCWLYRHS